MNTPLLRPHGTSRYVTLDPPGRRTEIKEHIVAAEVPGHVLDGRNDLFIGNHFGRLVPKQLTTELANDFEDLHFSPRHLAVVRDQIIAVVVGVQSRPPTVVPTVIAVL